MQLLLISAVYLRPLPSHASLVSAQVFFRALPSKPACRFQSVRVCFLGNSNYKSSAVEIVFLRDFCIIKDDYIYINLMNFMFYFFETDILHISYNRNP